MFVHDLLLWLERKLFQLGCLPFKSPLEMNDLSNPMITSNVVKFSARQETETAVKLNGTIFVARCYREDPMELDIAIAPDDIVIC